MVVRYHRHTMQLECRPSQQCRIVIDMNKILEAMGLLLSRCHSGPYVVPPVFGVHVVALITAATVGTDRTVMKPSAHAHEPHFPSLRGGGSVRLKRPVWNQTIAAREVDQASGMIVAQLGVAPAKPTCVCKPSPWRRAG